MRILNHTSFSCSNPGGQSLYEDKPKTDLVTNYDEKGNGIWHGAWYIIFTYDHWKLKLNKRRNIKTLKWIVPRHFRLQAFHESVSSKALGIPLGSFKFFLHFSEIFAAHGAPLVALTPITIWKKSSIRKGLIILFGHPLGSRVNI